MNCHNVSPELAGIRQRAVDAAIQVPDAVSVPETERGRQPAQRKGRQLAGQPRRNVSADRLGAKVAKYLRIDPAVRGHG